jgi:hypothetical protein
MSVKDITPKKGFMKNLIVPNPTEEDLNETLESIKGNPKKERSGTAVEKKKIEPKKNPVLKKAKKAEVPVTSIINLENFEELMASEIYGDDKDRFMFSLSEECVALYSKLSALYSYKKNVKKNKNDIMRQVLENFIASNYENIATELEKLK